MPASVTHILPLTTIRRARTIPQRGRITVRVGQKVNATDTVAEYQQPARHVLVDVRRVLGIQRPAGVQRVLERTVGEQLAKGDVIAQTGGIFARVVRAPEDCTIVAIQKGQVLLELNQQVQELKAGMNGFVSEVMPELGVVIETSGALIQGAWGNGQVNSGLLQVISKSPEDELTRAEIDVILRGAVVLGGHVITADALQAAAELPLRGLVLGSMTADLMPIAQGMPFPILLLEGFGRIAINASAYKLLLSHAKRDVSLNTNWSSDRSEVPELVVPLPAEGQMASEHIEFEPGRSVKILRPPYTSQIGVISLVRPGVTLLPNGLRVPAADVRLETNEQVLIPLANLTVIE